MRRIWNNLTSISLLPALFTCICQISCSQDKAAEALRSAYYWSTTWQMDSSKMNFIQKHHIKRLYVRFFDVVRDADGEIMPNATLQFDTTEENMTAEEKEKESLMPKGMEIIPVVYIVNDCFKAKTKTNPISSILFQGPHSVVYTNWENTRRIAFSRDGYTFVFNSYRLPADQWTTIRIEGDYKGTSLYINGALQERLEGRTMQVYRKEYDRMEHMTYQETLIFPLQQIGDSRNGFKGKLKNILVRQQH